MFLPGREPVHLVPLVDALLGAPELVVTRTRKGREVVDDLRPSVLAVEVLGPTADGTELSAELATQPRGVRPEELLAVIDPTLEAGRICRIHQWIALPDGARAEPLPLPLDATWAPHAEARAS
jgi:hypothetical protein